MSYLAFHFQEGAELHLKGMERHYLGSIVDNAAFGALGMHSNLRANDAVGRLKPFLPKTWPDRLDDQYSMERFALTLSHGQDALSWKGKTIANFAIRLNTAIVFGSDPVALAAKMHGTCEIHGWFLGKDRAWLADVIEQGLDTGIYRRSYWAPRDPTADLRTLFGLPVPEQEAEYIEHSMGWTEIIQQLRSSDEGAVVMSYSITEDFPDMPADWTPETPLRAPGNDWETLRDIKYEAFAELSSEEQFALGLQELKKDKNNKPISPESMRPWLFRHELTLIDLVRGDIPKIEKALKIEGETW